VTSLAVAGKLSHDDLVALERALESDPETMADLTGSAVAALDDAGNGSPEVLAALLDLRGRALFRLSRHEESADAYRRAIDLDPGTEDLTWFRDSEPVWTAEIDPGNGRLVRAGRSFVFAGRKEEARAALSRVVALGADEETRVFWGLLEAGAGALPDAAGSELLAPDWFERIPPLRISGLDGPPIEVSDRPGRVVLLDFWASWCAPCRVELPRLQALVRQEAANGLFAVAVNTDESDDLARAAATSIGVTLPIGRYDETLDELFVVRQLPAVVLVDQDGRIRRRWDGYQDGIEREIAAASRALLADPDQGVETVKIGTSIPGPHRLEVRWSRDMEKPVGGVAAETGGDDPPRVFVLAGRAIVVVRADGKIGSGFEAPPGSGRLVVSDVTGDGRSDVVGFRPGSDRVAILDPTTGAAAHWTAPAPCIDVTTLPPGEAGRRGLLLSTTQGLFVASALGEVSSRMPESTRSARPVVRNGETALLALLAGGRLRWIDADGKTASDAVTGLDGWSLVTSAGGAEFGVGPPAVVGSAVGRLLPGDGAQIAVATRSGRLVVLEAGSGKIIAVALIPGIGQIQAVDLDEDGLDEILVAAGERISVLGTVVSESPN
jgi:thiol-disulfide isomerase/thioredoxin